MGVRHSGRTRAGAGCPASAGGVVGASAGGGVGDVHEGLGCDAHTDHGVLYLRNSSCLGQSEVGTLLRRGGIAAWR